METTSFVKYLMKWNR